MPAVVDAHDWPERPTTSEHLHAWIERALGACVGQRAVVPGHSAPMRYIEHTFFEDGPGPGDAAQDVAAERGAAGRNGASAASEFGIDRPRDCVVWANRGGGKTFLGAVATALDLVFKPGIEVRILGGSLEQSRRMHEHLRRLLGRPELAWMVEGRITERRVRLRNGSSAEILAQSQTSVRGARVQKLRCDEVDLFDPRVWSAAQLATRSAECGGVRVRACVEALSTMHLPHGVMHDLVDSARRGERALFRWGLLDVVGPCASDRRCAARGADGVSPCALGEDCEGALLGRQGPGGHVELADALAMRRRVGRDVWESEMLCLRPRRSDAVLPEFEHDRHVVCALPAPLERGGVERQGTACDGVVWIGGMDFGMRAPTVVLWAALDRSNVLWIVDEHVRSGLLLEEHVRLMRERGWPELAWIGVDPAGGQRNSQTGRSDIAVLRQCGMVVRSRHSTIDEGVRLVRARLAPAFGEPTIRIHQRCVRLIESMARYHYNPDRPGDGEPVKDGFDHQVDALRYMLINLDRPLRARAGSYL